MVQDVKIIDRRYVSAGTVVIQQGAIGSNAYIIESGKVEVFITDDTGNITVVAELGPEVMFGEMSAVAGGLRRASVRTVQDSVFINILAEDMQTAMRSSTGFYTRLMRMVTDRMWDNNMKLRGEKSALGGSSGASAITLKDIALHVAGLQQGAAGNEDHSFLSSLRSMLRKLWKYS